MPEENRAQGNPLENSVSEGLTVKTLGGKWLPETDELVGEVNNVDLRNGNISAKE